MSGPLAPGNIDLEHRPVVKNADGSISTVRSMSINVDGKEVLIPTVTDDGRVVPNEEAVRIFKKTGKNLGTFANVDDANRYAKQLHESQAALYDRPAKVSDTLLDLETKKPIRTSTPEEAEAVYRSGKAAFAKGTQVHVVNQAGEVGTLPEGPELARALDAGVKFASPEQIAQAREEARHAADKEKYGGLEGQKGLAGVAANSLQHGITQGASVARGLTAGLSDEAAADLGYIFGGEKGKQEVSGRLRYAKEEHPIESGIGEVEGMLLPVPGVGSGIGGAARAAEGLTARALTREGAGAFERVAVKGLSEGAAAATEGAIRGAGEVVSEHALGEDPELTGEKILAGATHGAVSWGLAGGVLGGVGAGFGEARGAAGRFLQRLRPADVDALAEKQFGFVPKGLGDLWGKAADASSALSGGDVTAIRRLSELSPAGAEARRLAVFDAPIVREQAAREVRSQLDALLDSSQEITQEAKGRLKASYVEAAVKKGNEAEVVDFAQRYAADLRAHVEDMLAKPKEYGLVGSLKGMQEWLDALDGKIASVQGGAFPVASAAEEAGASAGLPRAAAANDNLAAGAAERVFADNSSASLFSALDDTKRAFGRWTKAAQAVEKKSDPLALMRGRATRDRLQGIYDDMRQGLENEDLWGKAASDQKQINAAWSKQIDAQRVFDARLTTNVGRDPRNPWVDIRRVDPAKADAYVAGLTNPNNDLVHSAIKNYVQSTRDLSEAIGRSWELPAEKAAHVAKVGSAAEAFGGSLDKAEHALTLANQFQALKAAEGGSAADMVTGAIVGTGLGGPIGGILGGVAGAMAKPGNTIARLAALERLMQKVDLRIGSSVRGFFRGSTRGASSEAASLRLGSKWDLASEGARERGTASDAFMRSVAKVTELASNPGASSKRVADSLAGLDQAAPQTSAQLSAQTMRVTTFLASKVPPGMHDPFALNQKHATPLVSESEKARFLRYVAAANDPTTVLEDMQHGRLTPEAVEALRACYPKLYEQVRGEIVEHLASADSPLPYGKRVQLGLLFDAPTDATLDPEFLKAISGHQAASSAEAEMQQPGMKGGPPAKELTVANSFQSTFEAARSGERK